VHDIECYLTIQVYEKKGFQMEGNSVFKVVEVRKNMMFSRNSERRPKGKVKLWMRPDC
jgi:hypothetical protein